MDSYSYHITKWDPQPIVGGSWARVHPDPLNYNSWVGVFYQNFDFSFLGQVFQYCLLGLKSVSVEDRITNRWRH
jgi:hypothetical protein